MPCSKGAAELHASRSITTVCQEAESTASKAALQDTVGVATYKLIGGELVESNITDAQHTEYMSVMAMATDEAESRHGKVRRR